MLDIHHFSYGLLTPLLAYTMSVTGCLLGLQCAARARSGKDRIGWIIAASVAIGGTGIWVMHFIAMLGFSIRGTEIRYNIPLTLLSAITAIVVVGIGLVIVIQPEPSLLGLFSGGAVTGIGVGAMHYTGMYAMKSDAVITYDTKLVTLSMIIAVVAATVALWFTLRVKGFLSTVGASLIMGVAVCGMHYTGMASMHAHTGHMQPPEGAGAMQVLGPLIVASSVVTMMLLISVSLTEIDRSIELPPLRVGPRPKFDPLPPLPPVEAVEAESLPPATAYWPTTTHSQR